MTEQLDLPQQLEGTIDRDVANVPSRFQALTPFIATIIIGCSGMVATFVASTVRQVDECPELTSDYVSASIEVEGDHRAESVLLPPSPGVRYPMTERMSSSFESTLVLDGGTEGSRRLRPPWAGFDSIENENESASRPIPPPLGIACNQWFEGSTEYPSGCLCYLDPRWVTPRGVELPDGGVAIVYRSGGQRHDLCGPDPSEFFQEQDYRYVIAWGTEGDWSSVTLRGSAKIAPKLALRQQELTLCLPKGFYRVDTRSGRGSPFEPWPMRFRLPRRMTLAFVTAIAVFVLLGLWSFVVLRRASRLISTVKDEEEIDATVTYLRDEGLTFNTTEGKTIVLDWKQLVDVFESDGGLALAWGGDDAKIPIFRHLIARRKWDTSTMETGQRVELLLEAHREEGMPYRSGLSTSNSVAYVLHGNVMATQLRSALESVAFYRWFPWPLTLVSLIIGSIGLYLCLEAYAGKW